MAQSATGKYWRRKLVNDYTSPIVWLLGLIVVLAAVVLAVWIVDVLVQLACRSIFKKQYGVSVPYSVRLKHSRQRNRIGAFIMHYPTWRAAKKDGTRDRRTNNMRIDRNRSVILVGDWKLLGKDPFEAYALVIQLRTAGTTIGYCAEEQAKRRAVIDKVNVRRSANSIDGIIQQFKEKPVDFESFCADLFRRLGWWAQQTPPVRDGGFDLYMRSPQGKTYIAECKCYDRRHHVGRPIIQKLQGANMVEHAQGMMLITTSAFSSDAVNYARQVGVELVDGAELVKMCQQAFGASEKEMIPESAFMLTRGDIMSRIPADMRNRYC